MGKRLSTEKIEAVKAALQDANVSIKQVSRDYEVGYDACLYYYRKIHSKNRYKFSTQQIEVLKSNPDRLSVPKLAELIEANCNHVYDWLYSNKKELLWRVPKTTKEQRIAIINRMAAQYRRAAISFEIGIPSTMVTDLAKEIGVTLDYNRTLLLPYADKIRKLGKTMCTSEIYAALKKEVKESFTYCTLTEFVRNHGIEYVHKKGKLKGATPHNKIDFQQHKATIDQMLPTHKWADIAKAIGVSTLWLRQQRKAFGIEKPVKEETRKPRVRTKPSKQVVKVQSQQRVIKRDEDKPMEIKNSSTVGMRAVRIDSRTVVFRRL